MASKTATLKWESILDGQARAAMATYWTGQKAGTGMRHILTVMIAHNPAADKHILVIHTSYVESKPRASEILSQSVHDSAAAAAIAVQDALNTQMAKIVTSHNAGCSMPGCRNASGMWTWDAEMWA